MRVLHVIRTLEPAWGGPVQGLRSISSLARKEGIRPEVLCVDKSDAPWLSSWDIPVHPVGPAALGFRYGFTNKLDQWLDQHLKEFDVVLVHGIWMYFSWAVWRAATEQKVPYHVFTHGALSPWFQNYRLKQIKKTIYWRLFEHKVIRDATAVLFTTEEERTYSREAFRPYCCNPIVIDYGITPPPVDQVKDKDEIIRQLTVSFPDLGHRHYLLSLGRIHAIKGVDLLIEAFSCVRELFPDTALVIAGSGQTTAMKQLKTLAARLGLADQIVWTDSVFGETKWALMRGADAFVLPSHQENFGISVAEALGCGTPVLISDKVNIWPAIRDAGAGLVETDDVEGTVNLLRRWRGLNADVKQQMADRAAECFATHFDIGRNSQGLFKIIRSSMAA